MIGRNNSNHSSNNDGKPEGTFWWFYAHPMTLILLVVVFVLIGWAILGPVPVVTLGIAILNFAATGYGGSS
ncbi:hypothetical protein ABIB34_004204 [Rhodococcus sp. UYP5]